jgi:chemotaxis protein MotB
MSAHHPVIIVKKKKGGHAGHHGGAWKVAYADFVTAMMAFFLVMWLVSQSKPVKQAVAGYFRDPGAFDAQQGKGILPGATEPSQGSDVKSAFEAAERAALERSVNHIRDRLDSVPEFKTLQEQIEFTITNEGLRIELLEASGSSFFSSGSAGMRTETEKILAIIARELGTLDNSIILEGHTDSHQYVTTDRYTNWELSADRANAARRVMQRDGLKPSQVVGVRGHADRQLKVAANPSDPRNRRVSVLVRSNKPVAEPSLRQEETAPPKPTAPPKAAAPRH